MLHVAKLARLALTDEEVERFRGQLSAILEAVGKVSELDLEGVPPTSHPLDLVNVSPRTSRRRRSPARTRWRTRPTRRAASSGCRRYEPGCLGAPSLLPAAIVCTERERAAHGSVTRA